MTIYGHEGIMLKISISSYDSDFSKISCYTLFCSYVAPSIIISYIDIYILLQ